MKRKNADFLYGNLSDVGKVRSENQDYFGRYSGDFGQLIIVCDGMGGYEGGAIASRLAVESIAEHFKLLGKHYDPRFELEQAYTAAQRNIKEYTVNNPETKGMGTTAVLLLIIDSKYWFANTGDSRLYLKRDGKTRQLTKDHSLVQGMVDNGILTEAQAEEHPKRNIITRALGTDNYTPDISGPYSLYRSDVFMLCSDGLYHYFTLTELSAILDKEPQIACVTFVDIANQQGSDDNVTVQIVKSNIGEVTRKVPKKRNKLIWFAVLTGSLLLLLVASIYLSASINKVLSPYAKRVIPKQKSAMSKTKPDTAKVTAVQDTTKKATIEESGKDKSEKK